MCDCNEWRGQVDILTGKDEQGEPARKEE